MSDHLQVEFSERKMNSPHVSIIMPAKNEASSLDILLPQLGALPFEAEIIVVDDGSTDATRDICLKHGVKVISNPYGMGNGAAIKPGRVRRLERCCCLWMRTASIGLKTSRPYCKNILKATIWLSARGRKDRMPMRSEL